MDAKNALYRIERAREMNYNPNVADFYDDNTKNGQLRRSDLVGPPLHPIGSSYDGLSGTSNLNTSQNLPYQNYQPQQTQSHSNDLLQNIHPNNSSEYYSKNVYPLLCDYFDNEEDVRQQDSTPRTSITTNRNSANFESRILAKSSSSGSERNQELYNRATSGSMHDYDTNLPYDNIRQEDRHILDKSALPSKVQQFKARRKMRTAASAGTGAIVGAFVLGPVGMVAGGYGAYAIAKKVGKYRERKLLDRCTSNEANSFDRSKVENAHVT